MIEYGEIIDDIRKEVPKINIEFIGDKMTITTKTCRFGGFQLSPESILEMPEKGTEKYNEFLEIAIEILK